MLSFLPAPLIGVIANLLYFGNLFIGSIVLLLAGLFRWLIPIKTWRNWCTDFIHWYPTFWISTCDRIMRLTVKTTIETPDFPKLNPKKSHLIISNHQSWMDIVILFSVFNHKIPIVKFFIKKQLQWMPLISVGAKLLEYPFMERHTKAQIQARPELKGKDIETVKKACQKFKGRPTTLVNFCEGTRFTPEKQQRQNSPYRNLLRPKTGGAALVINSLKEDMDVLLNVTVIYPHGLTDAWAFCCGKLDKIIVHVEAIPITSELYGDYDNDPNYRSRMQQFINQLWSKKDELIQAEHDKHPATMIKQELNSVS